MHYRSTPSLIYTLISQSQKLTAYKTKHCISASYIKWYFVQFANSVMFGFHRLVELLRGCVSFALIRGLNVCGWVAGPLRAPPRVYLSRRRDAAGAGHLCYWRIINIRSGAGHLSRLRPDKWSTGAVPVSSGAARRFPMAEGSLPPPPVSPPAARRTSLRRLANAGGGAAAAQRNAERRRATKTLPALLLTLRRYSPRPSSLSQVIWSGVSWSRKLQLRRREARRFTDLKFPSVLASAPKGFAAEPSGMHSIASKTASANAASANP